MLAIVFALVLVPFVLSSLESPLASIGEYCDHGGLLACNSSAFLACVDNHCRCVHPSGDKTGFDFEKGKCVVLSNGSCANPGSDSPDCAGSAICASDGTCSCPPSFYFSKPEGLCVPRKGYGEKCANTEECRADRLLTCVQGTCFCGPGAEMQHLSWGRFECKGLLGHPCFKNDDCATSNSKCGNRDRNGEGKCQCKNQFEESDGKCVKLEEDQSCCGKLKDECGPELHCGYGPFQCPLLEEQFYDRSRNSCVSYVGATCKNQTVGPFPCVRNAECVHGPGTEEFICDCKKGFIGNLKRFEYPLVPGASFKTTAIVKTCKAAQAGLCTISGDKVSCDCHGDQKYFLNEEGLCERKRSHGGNCSDHIYCDGDKHLICGGAGTCSCNGAESYLDLETKTCIGFPGTKCYSEEHGSTVCVKNAHCSKELEWRCGCDKGFEAKSNGCFVEHGGKCRRSEECDKDNFSCINGRCQCQLPAQQVISKDKTHCLSKVGAPCQIKLENDTVKSYPCADPNSVCKEGPSGKGHICVCRDGFAPTDGKDKVCKKLYGEQCDGDEELCNDSKKHGLVCKDGVCVCNEFRVYDEDFGECIRVN